MWVGIVFFLLYVIAPIACVSLLAKFGRGSTLSKLAGLSAGPLCVSLCQYGLYALFPGKESWFYLSVIGFTFLLILAWGWRQAKELIRETVAGLKIKRAWLSYGALFVAGITVFVFIKSVIYPPVWGDVYEYIEQAYVYSQDKGLWRFNTAVPFTTDSTYYAMNNAIRPGIPMLYSLFFLGADPTPHVLSLTQFVYFYYFVLLLFTVTYGIKLLGASGKHQLGSLILLMSSFYILRFAIYGAKEIILMELALLSLYALYKLGKAKKIEWKYLVMMSMTMGLSSFVNLSGTIIAGIIGLIFIFWVKYPIKIRLWTATCLAVLTLLFGGLEPWNGAASFILNPLLLSQNTKVEGATNLQEAELSNYQLSGGDTVFFGYHLDITKLNVLLKGKLQAFTQPQYFGFVFYIWAFVMLLAWRKREKTSELEKLLLTYVSVYFFIIMDPFSLNPHKYAYVLAISPKYSLMLVPMVVIMITGKWKLIVDLINKLPKQIVYYFGGLAILLIPWVRHNLANYSWQQLSQMIAYTRDNNYYLDLLSELMMGTSVAGLLIAIFGKYWQKHLSRLVVIVTLILPTIFLLNSNFGILTTLCYTFSPLQDKLVNGTIDEHNKEAFTLVNYINKNMGLDDQIIFLFRDNRIAFFINNRARVRMPINAFRLIHLEEHLGSGSISAKYLIYTSAEAEEPLLQVKPTKEYAQVGPYFIREVINEK